MASQLTGLFRNLSWSDFRSLTRPRPTPGHSAVAAKTEADANYTWAMTSTGGRHPQVQFADSMKVTVTFDAASSWQADWVQSLPQGDQDRLLVHEQHHYDLVALLARDFFVELIALTTRFYTDTHRARSDLDRLYARTMRKAQPIQHRYDTETNHGSIQPKQDDWNRYINTAFTMRRYIQYVPFAPDIAGPPRALGARYEVLSTVVPVAPALAGTTAADGSPLKPILEVLRDAGITL